jgi:enamine deaminase RidA (YjgF/YER057c/UK114 family)
MTFRREDINPPSLAAPRGYQNGVKCTGGAALFIAGQIGWDKDARLVSGGFVAQFEQALRNVLAVVEAAGGGPANIAQLTVFVTDRRAYLAEVKEVGAAWRRVMGRSFPAMALVEVRGLVEDGALVEIQGTAVVPEEPR